MATIDYGNRLFIHEYTPMKGIASWKLYDNSPDYYVLITLNIDYYQDNALSQISEVVLKNYSSGATLTLNANQINIENERSFAIKTTEHTVYDELYDKFGENNQTSMQISFTYKLISEDYVRRANELTFDIAQANCSVTTDQYPNPNF